MYIKTKSKLPPHIVREGLIKTNTVYRVLKKYNKTVDVVKESNYILIEEEDYTIVTFKNYLKLCSK